MPFGKDLVIEREGVRVAKKRIPWDTLRGSALERGMVVLKVQKRSGSVPVSSIPNLDLLLAILKERVPQPT